MRDALKAARDALDQFCESMLMNECSDEELRSVVNAVDDLSPKQRSKAAAILTARAAIAQADAALAVVADERAAFEAAMRALHPVECKAGVLGRVTNTASARFDMYGMFDVQLAWELWQARSRLGSHADVEDAERYRWLRDNPRADVRILHVGAREGAALDAAIDLARKEQT